MFRRLWPAGLRGRLVAAIMIVAAAILGASFFVLHERTGADLRAEIDHGLASDLNEFRASPAAASTSPAELRRSARAFIASQGYHPDSRIFAISIGAGNEVVTNVEELIRSELEEESDEHAGDDSDASGSDDDGSDGSESEDGEDEGDSEDEGEGSSESGAGPGETGAGGPGSALLSSPTGLATVSAGGDDGVRVLTQPIESPAGQIGTFRVAESLGQVNVAEGSLTDTVLLVGIGSLVLLLAAAASIATVTARPLSRMARFAAEVDRADLDRRLELSGGPTEVRSLADSFNKMLARLQRSFQREREFVADASHELRTPITVAQGELDLLRREADSAERERLDLIRRELKRMERLIAEMLTLASEDAGGQLQLEPIPVSDLLADLRRDLPLLGPRDYRVAELGGVVEADLDRLTQVLRNLLRNAVAHTQEGDPISVDARAVEPGRIRFDVRDAGPGISPEDAEHVFDRFYRTGADRSREKGGSGLGLAIARAIVEAHDGRIWVETGSAGGHLAFELPRYRG